MKIKSIFLSLIFFGAILLTGRSNAAVPGEGIVFDSSTGNYTVSYFVELDDGSKLLQKTIFEPATQIDPLVQSKFRLEETNRILYRYAVSNGSRSRQALDTIRFVFNSPIFGNQDIPENISPATEGQVALILDANTKALVTPLGWGSGIFPSNKGGVRVSWNSINHGGIQPGNSVAGFGFTSTDIPGLGTVEFEGLRKRRITYAGDGPQGEVKQQLSALRQKDFVPRNAAVPTIAVPTPFNAAVLIDRIRTHVATWSGMQLLDSAFAAQLDRSLVAAANAYRLNNSKAGRENIESVRKLLEHEHRFLDHDDEGNDDTEERKAATRLTIDRLAARVLDFDLRYVLMRTEHEHEESDRRKER
jgi:hypothetical protein